VSLDVPSVPKAVLFDLDDTLLDRARTFERYFDKFAARYADRMTACDAAALREAILEADGRGYRARDEMARMLLKTLPWRTPPTVREVVDNYRADFLDCAHISEGIGELLDHLTSRGIKTGVITNGESEVQRRKLERMDLTSRLNVIAVSEEVGVKKPHPAIFRLALNKLGVEPREVWFIGDHPDLDIAAAEAVGMTAFWLPRMTPWPTDRPACQRRIESLREVMRLIP
jgi:putative hydrolase of the HAD superfamily